MNAEETLAGHQQVLTRAKQIFNEKNITYGDSWKVMDILYIADRMLVKCKRITQLLTGEEAQVDEDIPTELLDVINYALIGLMQLKKSTKKLSYPLSTQAVSILYDECAAEVRATLEHKNHDYHNAWVDMRYPSLITQLKVKLARILQEKEETIALDPVPATDHFQDAANYAVFALLHPQAPYNH